MIRLQPKLDRQRPRSSSIVHTFVVIPPWAGLILPITGPIGPNGPPAYHNHRGRPNRPRQNVLPASPAARRLF